MFLRATKPIPDSVTITAAGAILDEFTAHWRRPNKEQRQALLQNAVDRGRELDRLSKAFAAQEIDFAEYKLGINAVSTSVDTELGEWLDNIDGLFSVDGEPIAYSADVLASMLTYSEYSNALAESLSRMTVGAAELVTKNLPAVDGIGLSNPQ